MSTSFLQYVPAVGMKGDESELDTTNPSKRRRTHLMLPAQTEPVQADNVEDEMGLHIFDSRDLIEGTQDIDSSALLATIQPTITTHDDQERIQPDGMIDPPRRIRTPRKKKHLVRDRQGLSHQQLQDFSRKGTKPNAGTKP